MSFKRVKLLIVTVLFVVSGSFALYRWQAHKKYPPLPDVSAFDVEFPEEWAVRNPRKNLTLAVSPAEGDDDVVRENMTVGVERLAETMTAVGYLQAHIDEAVKKMANAQPGEIRQTTLSGRPAREVEITYEVQHDTPPTEHSQTPEQYPPPSLPMRVWLTVTVDDQHRGYAIAATAPEETFEDFRNAFRTVIESFSIVESESPGEDN
jgi:hypothetical protein